MGGKDGVCEEIITGRMADLFLATHYAVEITHRLLRPGNKNAEITAAIHKVAKTFNVNLIQGEKAIIMKAEREQKVEICEFAPNEVWAIDIVMSTGAGKPRESEERTTIYKRSYDNFYRVKRKTSKDLLWKINKKYPSFPFTLRYFDEKKVNFGIKEIADHELVNPYPSVVEKEGELVCQTKFTALLLPSGTKKNMWS